MPFSPGYVLYDRYRIDGLLGQGGMGAVYDAWDTRLGIRCAVKENLLFTESAQRQFEREARLLATLRHPHLPRVSDHFLIPGQGQYLVMDFVEGEDLRQRVERLGPLPEADVLRWCSHILDALAYLHKRGIIHRDIKPANIKVTPEDEAMLVDFGISKQLNVAGGQTVTGAQGLTPGFAPPEQYGMGSTGTYTDVYSLGATLYVLLTAQVPADALSRMSKPEKFIPLSRQTLNISQPLTAMIDRALAMEPDERFTNATEMQAALQTGLEGGPQPLLTEPGLLQRPTVDVPTGSSLELPTEAPPVSSTPLPVNVRPEADLKVRRSTMSWGCWLGAGLLGVIVLVGGIGAGLIGLNALGFGLSTPTAQPTATPTLTPTLPPTLTATPPPPTLTPTAVPTPLGGGGGLIAFATNRDIGGNLKEVYVMRVDGSEQTRLTDNPSDNEYPTWSPDGERIAFYSFREGNAEIYVMNADGSNLKNLTRNPLDDFDPVWSPDGTWIAFTVRLDANDREVYILNVESALQTTGDPGAINLTNNPTRDTNATWSPDSTRIAFASDRDGNQNIYVMGVDGSAPTRLTDHAGFDAQPAWSPNGKWIAFISDRDGNLELYLLEVEQALRDPSLAPVVRLTNNPTNDLYPAWSPDGRFIAFISNRDGDMEIFAIDVQKALQGLDGSELTQLTDNSAEDFSPVWQP